MYKLFIMYEFYFRYVADRVASARLRAKKERSNALNEAYKEIEVRSKKAALILAGERKHFDGNLIR